MTWFKRHLNWTLTLSVLVGSTVLNILSFTIESTGELFIIWWISLILVVIFSLTVEIWYLKQKGRSLGYLALNLLNIIGFLILLGLENKKELTLEEK